MQINNASGGTSKCRLLGDRFCIYFYSTKLKGDWVRIMEMLKCFLLAFFSGLALKALVHAQAQSGLRHTDFENSVFNCT